MTTIQTRKRDIETAIEFFRRFLDMDEARRSLMKGGSYVGDKRLVFEKSWDHLMDLEGEMNRIASVYAKEEADVR